MTAQGPEALSRFSFQAQLLQPGQKQIEMQLRAIVEAGAVP